MANTFNLGNGNWAQKTEKLLAYNAENDNYKPLPFDFDRASTATRVNKQGLIETVGVDEPRIDFLNNTKGHLLLEPSRSNVIQNSEVTSTWTYTEFGGGSAGTITTGKIDMFGGTNAVQVDFPADTENVAFRFGQSTSSISSGSVATSVYIKLVESGSKTLQLRASSAVVSLINVNSTDFVRYEMTGTKNSSEAFSLKLRPSEGTSSGGFSIIICHPQVEAGSYATSYIPTSGSAVTRSAETNYQQNVTQVIGQSEGTMYIEFVPKDTLAPIQILCQIRSSSGTIGQTDIRLQGGNIRALANDGGSNQFNIDGGSYTAGTTYKVAIRYKLNDSKLYINGSSVGSDTSCSFTGSSLDQISFAENLSSLLPVADILDARLYDTGLSDAELQALTS